jgi:hypothetical protein
VRIDFKVGIDLSLDSFEPTSALSKLETSFRAAVTDTFDLTIGSYKIHVSPKVELFLQAKNHFLEANNDTIDIFNLTGGELTTFDFEGSLESIVLASVDELPAQVFVKTSTKDITSLTSLDFELGVDLILEPIKAGTSFTSFCMICKHACEKLLTLRFFLFFLEINRVLDEIGSLSYPAWLTEKAPFLPSFRLFLGCIKREGQN